MFLDHDDDLGYLEVSLVDTMSPRTSSGSKTVGLVDEEFTDQDGEPPPPDLYLQVR